MRKTILIVDEEKDFLDLLTLRLENYGLNTVYAFSCQETLDLYLQSLKSQEPYSLILIDEDVALNTGQNIIDVIRKEERALDFSPGEGIPIVILTASEGEWMKALDRVLDDWLMKPYSISQLLNKLKEKVGEDFNKI